MHEIFPAKQQHYCSELLPGRALRELLERPLFTGAASWLCSLPAPVALAMSSPGGRLPKIPHPSKKALLWVNSHALKNRKGEGISGLSSSVSWTVRKASHGLGSWTLRMERIISR